MNTSEVEYALINKLNVRQNYIITNVHWGIHNLHECDVLKVTKSGYATEYEIKISKADLLKDKLKKHRHESKYIKDLFFVVPDYLKELAIENIPERAGLIIVTRYVPAYYNEFTKQYTSVPFSMVRYKLDVVKQSKSRNDCVKWSSDDIFNLLRLASMRIHTYKKKEAKISYNNLIKDEGLKS